MPVAMEILLPKRDVDLLVDLTVQSFLLRVDAFRTRPVVLGVDMQVQQAVVKMPEVIVHGWKGPLSGLLRRIGDTYTATLAKSLPALIQSFKFATKALEEAVAQALTMLQDNTARLGQKFSSPARSTGQSGDKANTSEGSSRGVAVAAVTAVGDAAASAGGIMCDVVQRGRQSLMSSGTAGNQFVDVPRGLWSRLRR